MEKLICSNCGTENEVDSKFCKNCGTKLEILEATKEIAPEETDAVKVEASDIIESKKLEEVTVQKENVEVPQKVSGSSKKKGFNKKLFIPIAVVLLIIVFFALGSGPKVVDISVSYDGATEAGVVIDNSNEGLHVVGLTEDGTEVEIADWEVKEPVTLVADETAYVDVVYKDLECDTVVECSTSNVTEIAAKYKGSTKAGTVIDSSADIKVTEIHVNGSTTVNKTDWTVKEPVTLEADESSKVEVECNGFTTSFTVQCTTSALTKIRATYDGDTEEGAVLDESNTGIHVTAVYKNGDKKEVTGFKIEKAKSLKAGEETTIKISYENKKCTLKVQCSTMSKQQYKDKCKSIAYEDLARNPKKYEGEYVKFTGKVVQNMEDDYLGALRVNVTQDSYGFYDDTVYVVYFLDDENRILEDDIVTFYGTSQGLYSYESIMGATITIPSVYAEYVERN